jgi:hypothetical protein
LGNLAGWRTTLVQGAQVESDPRSKGEVPGQLQGGHEQQSRSATGDRSGFTSTFHDYPKVSNTNELQYLKNYIDEQRDQMQNIIGGMQKDYRRLVRVFNKSTVANFPSHEVELGENTRISSATGCHD